jgi:predicted transcriptional regulator of viral defense system
MAILEINGDKYKVNKKVKFTEDRILVDGVDISLLDKVTKKCKCVDNCKRNNQNGKNK